MENGFILGVFRRQMLDQRAEIIERSVSAHFKKDLFNGDHFPQIE